MVVTSPAGEAVRAYAEGLGAASAIQEQQLGTGHAAASARDALADFSGTLLIVNGDMPLITGDTISECLRGAGPHRPGACWRSRPRDPAAYGRVLLTPDGFLDRIVEFKDANAARARRQPVQCRLLCRRCAEFLPLGGSARKTTMPRRNITSPTCPPSRSADGVRLRRRGRRTRYRSWASTAAPNWPRRKPRCSSALRARAAGGRRRHDRAGDGVPHP